MADYRVVDIETVVDRSVWTPPAPKWVLAPRGELVAGPDGDLVPCPAGLLPDDLFAPPQAHRVVAVSWCDLTSTDNAFYLFEGVYSYCNWGGPSLYHVDLNERRLIAAFAEAQEGDTAQLVSWNGRGFDLPVLNLRALKHKIPFPWYYEERDVRYRYTEAGHCDLMDMLGDYGAARNMKLGDVCKLIGLPGKVGDVRGGSVAEIVAQGDVLANMDRVKRYCAQDALQTALLFVRTRYHKGMINGEQHDAAVESFAKSDLVNDLLPGLYWDGLKASR
jgi:hypothetical protein